MQTYNMFPPAAAASSGEGAGEAASNHNELRQQVGLGPHSGAHVRQETSSTTPSSSVEKNPLSMTPSTGSQVKETAPKPPSESSGLNPPQDGTGSSVNLTSTNSLARAPSIPSVASQTPQQSAQSPHQQSQQPPPSAPQHLLEQQRVSTQSTVVGSVPPSALSQADASASAQPSSQQTLDPSSAPAASSSSQLPGERLQSLSLPGQAVIAQQSSTPLHMNVIVSPTPQPQQLTATLNPSIVQQQVGGVAQQQILHLQQIPVSRGAQQETQPTALLQPSLSSSAPPQLASIQQPQQQQQARPNLSPQKSSGLSDVQQLPVVDQSPALSIGLQTAAAMLPSSGATPAQPTLGHNYIVYQQPTLTRQTTITEPSPGAAGPPTPALAPVPAAVGGEVLQKKGRFTLLKPTPVPTNSAATAPVSTAPAASVVAAPPSPVAVSSLQAPQSAEPIMGTKKGRFTLLQDPLPPIAPVISSVRHNAQSAVSNTVHPDHERRNSCSALPNVHERNNSFSSTVSNISVSSQPLDSSVAPPTVKKKGRFVLSSVSGFESSAPATHVSSSGVAVQAVATTSQPAQAGVVGGHVSSAAASSSVQANNGGDIASATQQHQVAASSLQPMVIGVVPASYVPPPGTVVIAPASQMAAPHHQMLYTSLPMHFALANQPLQQQDPSLAATASQQFLPSGAGVVGIPAFHQLSADGQGLPTHMMFASSAGVYGMAHAASQMPTASQEAYAPSAPASTAPPAHPESAGTSSASVGGLSSSQVSSSAGVAFLATGDTTTADAPTAQFIVENGNQQKSKQQNPPKKPGPPRNTTVGYAGRQGVGKMFYFLDQMRLEAMDTDRMIKNLQTDVRLLREKNKELEAKARDAEKKMNEEKALREAAESKLKVAKKKLHDMMKTEWENGNAKEEKQQVGIFKVTSSDRLNLDGSVIGSNDSLSGDIREHGSVKRQMSYDQVPGIESSSLAPKEPVSATVPLYVRPADPAVTPPRDTWQSRVESNSPFPSSTATTPVPPGKTLLFSSAAAPSEGGSPPILQHTQVTNNLPPLPSHVVAAISRGGTGRPHNDRPPLGASNSGSSRDPTLTQLSAGHAITRQDSGILNGMNRSLASEFDPLRPSSLEGNPGGEAAAESSMKSPMVQPLITKAAQEPASCELLNHLTHCPTSPQRQASRTYHGPRDLHMQLHQPSLEEGSPTSSGRSFPNFLFIVPQTAIPDFQQPDQGQPALSSAQQPIAYIQNHQPNQWMQTSTHTAQVVRGASAPAVPPLPPLNLVPAQSADPFDELVRRSTNAQNLKQ